MTDRMQPQPEQSLVSLLGGIIGDASDLLVQQLRMTKLEVENDLRKTKATAISLAIAIGIMALGAILLSLMLVQVLALLTAIPLWGCYGMVGSIFALVGGVLLATGKEKTDKIDFVPEQTVQTTEESAQWSKERTTSNRA